MPRPVTWNPKSLFKTTLQLITNLFSSSRQRPKCYSDVYVKSRCRREIRFKDCCQSFDELRESLFTFSSYCYYRCLLISILILADHLFKEQIIDILRFNGQLKNYHRDLLVSAQTKKLNFYSVSGKDDQNASALILELAVVRCQVCRNHTFPFFFRTFSSNLYLTFFAATYIYARG